jgi:glucokinase
LAEAQPRPVAIGIDIGGTKIAFGVVGADGRLRERVRVDAFEAAGPEVLLGRVGDVTRRLAEDLPAEGLAGVGVGTRELVGVDGEIHSASTLPWKRVDLASAVAPLELAALEADVRAGALAEARVGAGQVYENFVFLTVGTGISS